MYVHNTNEVQGPDSDLDLTFSRDTEMLKITSFFLVPTLLSFLQARRCCCTSPSRWEPSQLSQQALQHRQLLLHCSHGSQEGTAAPAFPGVLPGHGHTSSQLAAGRKSQRRGVMVVWISQMYRTKCSVN